MVMRIVPGDPVRLMVGRAAPDNVRRGLRKTWLQRFFAGSIG